MGVYEQTEFAGMMLLFVGIALAFVCGYHIWQAIDTLLRERSQKTHVIERSSELARQRSSTRSNWDIKTENKDLYTSIINYTQRMSQALALGKCRHLSPEFLIKATSLRLNELKSLAGLGETVSDAGFCETQMRLVLIGTVVGGIVGALFSTELALLLAIAAAIVGFRLPIQALTKRISDRADEVERHLPEMLDVIALGMRSGMSFDASLSLYSRHFDTMLAHELSNSQKQWTSGLTLRDDALRKVASTYDSVILGRVVETVIRSVRYGSSMVESLESDAAEARAVYQSQREERVAKAPVKMMIPTGILILPAMLILVLGPVLLELAGGGL